MTMPFRHGLTPKMKPISPKRSAIMCVLDIGTSKIVCMIVRLRPREGTDILPNRTHKAEILGIGHTRARGMKAGAVADMAKAEAAIRQAVDAAERMAEVQVDRVIATVSAGRIASEHYEARVTCTTPQVTDQDLHRVLEAASDHSIRKGRAVLHSMPVGFRLDETRGIKDPRGMLGSSLGVDMHIATCDAATARNLMLCIERCHLSVEALVAAPFASGLAVLTDDEAELGTVCLDMGAGTTTLSVFAGGHFVHADAVAVGSHHVTMDIARGLSTRLSDAERIKVLNGACFVAKSDERDIVNVPSISEDDRDIPNAVSRAQIIRIIRPRIDEILEMVRDRLVAAGSAAEAGRRLVLTGGGAQLPGLADLAAQVFGRQVRVARPVGITGLPDSAKGPPFAAAVGLTVYPQIAGAEHYEPQRRLFAATGTDGYFSRVGRWIRDSF
ncbi:cell division protein FtsA [Phreatobacter oligotrophus]|jgi:cell division protein FtsA|uniref:Cell division protein FtsA n=2 Tax=Phreatobacter oligotrophus TaxID=1122261 RepID=A0A2T4ZGL7_9HYPH|nr:cell division protein FtsA [Phreatobacter oligotrophus]